KAASMTIMASNNSHARALILILGCDTCSTSLARRRLPSLAAAHKTEQHRVGEGRVVRPRRDFHRHHRRHHPPDRLSIPQKKNLVTRGTLFCRAGQKIRVGNSFLEHGMLSCE